PYRIPRGYCAIDRAGVGCSNTPRAGRGYRGGPSFPVVPPSRSRPPLERALHRWWLALAAAACLAAPPAAASVEGETAFHRGVLAFASGQLDQARREFETVLALDPRDREALRYLAQILEAQGDPASALGLCDRLRALDPGDRELALDRAVVLLELGRNAEARAALAKVVDEDPGDAKVQLYAGIAASRAGALAAAPEHLRHAAELEPALAARTRYYTGVVAAAQGDLVAAQNAFAGVARLSPASPLGRSAAGLAEVLRQREAARAWSVSLADARRWDGAAHLDGSGDALASEEPVPLQRWDPGLRGLSLAEMAARVRASERWRIPGIESDPWGLRSVEPDLDLPARAGWASGAHALGPARLGPPSDPPVAPLSAADPFGQLRATPALVIPQRAWGLASPGGPLEAAGLGAPGFPPDASLARGGERSLFGLAPSFPLPQPRYVTLGAVGDALDPLGAGGRPPGLAALLGAGYGVPPRVPFSRPSRLPHRDYREASPFDPFARRVDDTHWLTAELTRPIVDHWIARVSGSFRFQDSNIPVYDQDRKAVGAYLTYEW